MRAVEATAIRLRDIDFSTNPTKIHVRKEYAKTKAARDVYISDEATQYLKQWINWKQRLRTDQGRTFTPEDLVFSIYSINKEPNPCNLYVKLIYEFQKLLAAAGMAERKESGIHKRRKITLHSMRRFCKKRYK
jgi:integrase